MPSHCEGLRVLLYGCCRLPQRLVPSPLLLGKGFSASRPASALCAVRRLRAWAVCSAFFRSCGAGGPSDSPLLALWSPRSPAREGGSMPPAKKRPCRRWPFVPAERFPSYPRLAPRLRALILQQRQQLRAQLVRCRERQYEGAALFSKAASGGPPPRGDCVASAAEGGERDLVRSRASNPSLKRKRRSGDAKDEEEEDSSLEPPPAGSAGAQTELAFSFPAELQREAQDGGDPKTADGDEPPRRPALETREQGSTPPSSPAQRLASPGFEPSPSAAPGVDDPPSPLSRSRSEGCCPSKPRDCEQMAHGGEAASSSLCLFPVDRFLPPRSEPERAVRLALLRRQLLLKRQLHARLVRTLGEVERRYEDLLEVAALEDRELAREREEEEFRAHIEKQQNDLETLHAAMQKNRAAQRADRERKLQHERLIRQRCREKRRRAQEEEIESVTSGAPPAILMKELSALSAFVAGGMPAGAAAAALRGGRRLHASSGAPGGAYGAHGLPACDVQGGGVAEADLFSVQIHRPDAQGALAATERPGKSLGGSAQRAAAFFSGSDSLHGEASESADGVASSGAREDACDAAYAELHSSRLAGPPLGRASGLHQHGVATRVSPAGGASASSPHDVALSAAAGGRGAQKGALATAGVGVLGSSSFAGSSARGGGALGRKGMRHRGGARAAAAAAATGSPTSNLALLRGFGLVPAGTPAAKAAGGFIGYGQPTSAGVRGAGRGGRCTTRGLGRGGGTRRSNSLSAPLGGSPAPAGKVGHPPGSGVGATGAAPAGAAAPGASPFASVVNNSALSPLTQVASPSSSWTAVGGSGAAGSASAASPQQILLPAGLTASHLAAFNANAAALQHGAAGGGLAAGTGPASGGAGTRHPRPRLPSRTAAGRCQAAPAAGRRREGTSSAAAAAAAAMRPLIAAAAAGGLHRNHFLLASSINPLVAAAAAAAGSAARAGPRAPPGSAVAAGSSPAAGTGAEAKSPLLFGLPNVAGSSSTPASVTSQGLASSSAAQQSRPAASRTTPSAPTTPASSPATMPSASPAASAAAASLVAAVSQQQIRQQQAGAPSFGGGASGTGGGSGANRTPLGAAAGQLSAALAAAASTAGSASTGKQPQLVTAMLQAVADAVRAEQQRHQLLQKQQQLQLLQQLQLQQQLLQQQQQLQQQPPQLQQLVLQHRQQQLLQQQLQQQQKMVSQQVPLQQQLQLQQQQLQLQLRQQQILQQLQQQQVQQDQQAQSQESQQQLPKQAKQQQSQDQSQQHLQLHQQLQQLQVQQQLQHSLPQLLQQRQQTDDAADNATGTSSLLSQISDALRKAAATQSSSGLAGAGAGLSAPQAKPVVPPDSKRTPVLSALASVAQAQHPLLARGSADSASSRTSAGLPATGTRLGLGSDAGSGGPNQHQQGNSGC
ncbi:hypothetical protein BESB_011930 [Besnoitia besnoiti]|uniref:Uncharacterized protein n=1 Tax=Besnoitia besnoiti TaxID=94643 RepID=A0A2A9M8F0_BESBE|nr:hypothetical protein BESB_011930 [Besnoitia besnoiti]PFH32581.1 hypothetical protein BESB_011930 [Besnoitia besnoiti]